MSAIADFLGGPTVVIAIVKVLIAFVALLLVTLLVVWAERKIIADMQSRVGPNRWGPYGLLQTLADGIKLFFKEDFRPRLADRWTYEAAPILAMVPSFLAFAVIPFGDHVTIAGHEIDFIVADLDIGVLFFLAAGSIGVYGTALAGWSSGSKYPLLGGVRASAQLISYEVALGLSIVPIVLVVGSLSTVDIVAAQAGNIQNITFFDGIPVLEQVSQSSSTSRTGTSGRSGRRSSSSSSRGSPRRAALRSTCPRPRASSSPVFTPSTAASASRCSSSASTSTSW